MRLRLPEKVDRIIRKLKKQGFEAFAVGGCVRDSILMRQPNDWDITTSAKPEEVKQLFYRTIDTGLEHGTVTVLLEGETFEVTTYRIDGEYEDARHPKEVVFTPDLKEDLKRRDFTINAMAYSDQDGLIDCFGGMRDLQLKVIRCVGDPKERFGEDALRILRAVRFAAQLGFSIDEKTKDAIKELAPNLRKISEERIQVELVKLLTSKNPQYFQLAYELGITKEILPEFDVCMKVAQHNPHHRYSVGEHMLKSVTFVEADKVLRLTMLLHDIGKPHTRTTDEYGIDHFHKHCIVGEKMAKEILKRLKFDNDTIKKVTKLIYWHDYHPQPTGPAVRRAIHKVGEELFPMLLKVQWADLMAQSDYHLEEKKELLEQVTGMYEHVLKEEQCFSMKQLAITGKDLIAAGIEPGPKIGEYLEKALQLVIEKPFCNTKKYLMDCVKKGEFR